MDLIYESEAGRYRVAMLDRVAHRLFRHRDALFPLVFAALLLLLPPRPLGDALGDILLWVGIALVIAGESVRVVAIALDYVKRGGKARRFYADRLVTGGLFAHCRNPMYLGNVLLLLGFLFVAGNPAAIAVGGLLVVLSFSLIIRGEERYLAERFGETYRLYCARVPRWRPRLRGLWTTLRRHPFDWRMVVIKEYGTLFVAMFVPVFLLGWKLVLGQGWSGLADRLPVFAAAGGGIILAWALARVLKKSGRLQPRSSGTTVTGLDLLRARIDRIDARILRLLNERADLVSTIFVQKQAAGVPRFDRHRTEQMLDRLVRLNRGPLDDAAVRRLFTLLLSHFAFEHDRAAPETESNGEPPAEPAMIATMPPAIPERSKR